MPSPPLPAVEDDFRLELDEDVVEPTVVKAVKGLHDHYKKRIEKEREAFVQEIGSTRSELA